MDFTAAKDAVFARLRVVQTSHGMDKPDGCGEFEANEIDTTVPLSPQEVARKHNAIFKQQL